MIWVVTQPGVGFGTNDETEVEADLCEFHASGALLFYDTLVNGVTGLVRGIAAGFWIEVVPEE